MTGAYLFGACIFSVIGLAAFVYGKKETRAKPLAVGILLMVFPYFAPSTTVLYVIGVVLTASLFVYREY